MSASRNRLPIESPPTITAYVMDSIRDGILTGRFPLGSRLDQKAVADELGVSLVPVREALRLLEGEGFVQIYPRRGAFVTDESADGLEELYCIREVLEEMATNLAVPNLSSSDLDKLDGILRQMERATAEQALNRLLELNAAFHFTIYEACERTLLVEMISGLWNRSSLYRQIFTYLPQRVAQAMREHQEIYAACLDGDAELAGKAIRNNIRQTVQALAGAIQETEKSVA